MESSDQNYLRSMNLTELREFAEQRGISTKIASRLWYALARKAFSQLQLASDKQMLTYDDNTETLYFYRNPQEYAENVRNIGQVSLQLLNEFAEVQLENHE